MDYGDPLEFFNDFLSRTTSRLRELQIHCPKWESESALTLLSPLPDIRRLVLTCNSTMFITLLAQFESTNLENVHWIACDDGDDWNPEDLNPDFESYKVHPSVRSIVIEFSPLVVAGSSIPVLFPNLERITLPALGVSQLWASEIPTEGRAAVLPHLKEIDIVGTLAGSDFDGLLETLLREVGQLPQKPRLAIERGYPDEETPNVEDALAQLRNEVERLTINGV